MKQQAEALRAQAEAEKFAAEQKAAGIAAIGEAEAAAIEKKAEAQKKMGEASVLEMYLAALPQVVEAAAAPLGNVKDIHMYGEGNSAKMVKDVMASANQIMEGLREATGIDITDILNSVVKKTPEQK